MPWAKFTRSVRRFAPKTQTRRGTWPSSGWSNRKSLFTILTDNMDLAEAFLKRIFRDALEKCGEDMEFFNERIDETKSLLERLQRIVESEFVRLPYTEAVEVLEKSGQKFDFPVKWGIDLQSRTRTIPDRRTFQKPGDPVRLSTHDQAVLHVLQRR